MSELAPERAAASRDAELVFVEAAAAADPPLVSLEEIGRDEVEIQVDLEKWDALALDHRNLLFWHEVGRIQNDAIPRDGWERRLGHWLGGAIGSCGCKTACCWCWPWGSRALPATAFT